MRIRLFWLLAALLAARAARAAELPAQKLLPKDTVMVVAVPDAGKALGHPDQFSDGPFVARSGGQGLPG